MEMEAPRIMRENDTRDGQAIVRGTDIRVTQILKWLAGGLTMDEIVEAYPDLHQEDVKAALEFAATAIEIHAPPRKPTVIFDLHAGAMEMADDFDDPLADEFWLGNDQV